MKAIDEPSKVSAVCTGASAQTLRISGIKPGGLLDTYCKSDRFTCRDSELSFVPTGRAAGNSSPTDVSSTVPMGIFKPPPSPSPCSAFLAWHGTPTCCPPRI
ncbi:unnamed protein product [Pleuronectes platessa]|uniref:Uncharacterized protein n=1 Tax=Pleuronectes platessa TaxID=8262 RepID=A0A9N7UIR8_PLEPL|nr:unnamed protein product [Pleuronectes platessa]